MKNEHGLTDQQEKFCLALSEGMTQSQAYRIAYPAALRWKPESVWNKATVLAGNAKVVARVSGLRAEIAAASVLKTADVLEQVRRLVMFNPQCVIGQRDDGKPVIRILSEIPVESATCIKSFKQDDLGRIEYQFPDKVAALSLAAKLLGMFETDNKQKADALATLLGTLAGNVVGPVAGAAVFEPKSDNDEG